jgi:hypothetical protein
MIDSRELPPSLRRDPNIMTARLDEHRRRLDDHESRLSTIEAGQGQPGQVDTPLGKLPVPVVLALVLLLAIWRPDLVHKLLP